MNACEHINVTSTFETGPICCDCRTLLISMFHPIPRALIEMALHVVAAQQAGKEQKS